MKDFIRRNEEPLLHIFGAIFTLFFPFSLSGGAFNRTVGFIMGGIVLTVGVGFFITYTFVLPILRIIKNEKNKNR